MSIMWRALACIQCWCSWMLLWGTCVQQPMTPCMPTWLALCCKPPLWPCSAYCWTAAPIGLSCFATSSAQTVYKLVQWLLGGGREGICGGKLDWVLCYLHANYQRETEQFEYSCQQEGFHQILEMVAPCMNANVALAYGEEVTAALHKVQHNIGWSCTNWSSAWVSFDLSCTQRLPYLLELAFSWCLASWSLFDLEHN